MIYDIHDEPVTIIDARKIIVWSPLLARNIEVWDVTFVSSDDEIQNRYDNYFWSDGGSAEIENAIQGAYNDTKHS